MEILVTLRCGIVVAGMLVAFCSSGIDAADGRSVAYSAGRESYMGTFRRPAYNAYWRPSQESIQEFMEKLYANVDVSHQELEPVQATAGAERVACGGISYHGLQILLDDLHLKESDVVYDLGLGVGKFCVQTYFNTPVKKVVGIDLGFGQCSTAKSIRKDLKFQGLLEKGRTLKFKNQDILKVHMNDATVVYIDSSCFSTNIIQIILKKLSALKSGLRLVTPKALPADYKKYGFMLSQEYSLPKGSSAYVYRLN